MTLAINIVAFLLCMAFWAFTVALWRSKHPHGVEITASALALAVVFGAVFLLVD